MTGKLRSKAGHQPVLVAENSRTQGGAWTNLSLRNSLLIKATPVLALILTTILALFVSCTPTHKKLESYNSLTESSQRLVQKAVAAYVQCAVQKMLKLDKGKRHVGHLAWTASEACSEEKNNIVHIMVLEGTTNATAFSYANDTQVRAAAAAIEDAQKRRSRN